MSDGDDLFRRNRPFNQLDGFYTEWSKHLTERCLPPLRDFPNADKNDAVLGEIRSYYDTLNHFANRDTILYLLFPSWRSNSLETPILFLGDIHPRLLTSLIQSFVDRLNQDPIRTFSNLAAAWDKLSSELGNTINETVSRLLREMREAQEGFIRRFSDKWVSSFLPSLRGYRRTVMETASSVTTDQDGGGAMIMEELVRIYREANQLREKTITDIVRVLDMNQTALFLESVCKILAGFKHQVRAFENSLFGHNLINHQLPENEELLQPFVHPSGEVNARHNDYPRPRMQQHASQLPPHDDQLFQPSRPRMMQQHAPQRPPPAMNQQHQQHPPEQGRWELGPRGHG